MDFINTFIDNYNIPLLTAFLLGILTSMSPCPLATNITAIAYISQEIKTIKNTLFNGVFYIIGRGVSYTLLATFIYFGFSSFHISSLFQGWGDKVLGPVLILISLIMFGILKINIPMQNKKTEHVKEWLAQKGYTGSFLLGMLFAFAFCPYSGVLFFGVLIPLVMQSPESLLLPPIFAMGTGLPVIIVSFILAFSLKKIGQALHIMQVIEKIMRYTVAGIFLLTGMYYMQFLILFIF